MVAMEYLVSYIFNTPEPYVDPTVYTSSKTVFKHAQALLAKWKKKDNSEYCHIGPGSGGR
jgi:hypothetical protein